MFKQICTIIIFGSILFALQLFAFTEPSSSPPGANTAAPLHVGSQGQTKTGGLILNTGGAEIGLIIDKGKVCIGNDCRTAWPAEVPSGFIGFFNLSSCPSGWSAYSSAQGRYVVGAPSGGSIGGTQGTALSNLENRPVGQHTHAISDPGHNHNFPVLNNIDSGGYGNVSRAWPTGVDNYYDTNSSQTNIAIGSAGSISGTNAPYIQLLACQKN